MKTFEIRVTNRKDEHYLINYIYKYRHWQNLLTILTINLFKSNNRDYKCFSDYAIIRACIADTKEKYKNSELYQELLKIGKELKTHNLVEIIKRLKKDFSNYLKTLKDYKNNPIDSYVSISFKKKNQIGIKSVKIKYQNNQIYLQFSYEQPETINYQLKTKFAGLDIGLNNLISLFTDDKNTSSLIIVRANEAYTSKISYVTEDVCEVQANTNGAKADRVESTCIDKNKRVKRGLFKDNQSFQWLKEYLWKLCNPVKLKSAGELHNLLCNIRSNKSHERRMTARAYRYAISY